MPIQEAIRKYIVENFLFGDATGLQDDDPLREKGIIDSTGVLELISFLESHFSIVIEDLEIIPENLDTIARMSAFVKAKQEGKPVKHWEMEPQQEDIHA
ncbi:MAG TPA: acyl carrier protein [bacterium]|nr:acyl carrier protein [bacterium]HPN36730.1 acyl carrier protein [bacterium]